MTADREALVVEVAGVLAKHHWGDDTAPVGRVAMRCGCGWKQSAVASRIYDLRARHDRHLAHALADLLDARDRRVRAEAWDEGHMLGEALAYNAAGDILWSRHKEVIGRSDYRAARAARVESLPHWDSNPHRIEADA